MSELPDFLIRGERARLFPVLADTSREGRTLSIFLASFAIVDAFGKSLLSGIGYRVPAKSRIEVFTEVVLKKGDAAKPVRPDGLIVVSTGATRWTALVEAKVGNSELTTTQMEAYLDLAKANGIDAIITLSNQFAPIPSHHPVTLGAVARKKAALYHWSWMYVLTQSSLLLADEDLTDREQRVILREVNRFLLHQSSGVKGFDQMPASWPVLVEKLIAGGSLSTKSEGVGDVVGAWHQEVGDLSLVLSRQLETSVRVRMPRAHTANPSQRQKAAETELADHGQLRADFDVPDAAGPIGVCADLRKRSITASIWLKAPDDPKTTKGRINWLIKQLQKSDPAGLHVRCYWPGRTKATQYPLEVLRQGPEAALNERPGQSPVSFEVLMVRDASARFSQRRSFIQDVETVVTRFYKEAGGQLKAWQARAPKLAKAEPADVSPEALREETEQDALDGIA